MMELVVATRNKGKLAEISRMLESTHIRVLGLDVFPEIGEIDEPGATFEENALIKAETVVRLTGRMTLADDSGLEVRVLGGEPGVRSARYAGENATDELNNLKLLKALTDVPPAERQAAFCCAMALVDPSGARQVFHGRVEGVILETPRGEGGFGYDPLFFVREYGKTMAELPMEVKNRISHRGQALRQAVEYLSVQGQ